MRRFRASQRSCPLITTNQWSALKSAGRAFHISYCRIFIGPGRFWPCRRLLQVSNVPLDSYGRQRQSSLQASVLGGDYAPLAIRLGWPSAAQWLVSLALRTLFALPPPPARHQGQYLFSWDHFAPSRFSRQAV